MQACDVITGVLAKAKRHPNVVLEGKAFPGMPSELTAYITKAEETIASVQRLVGGVTEIAKYVHNSLAYLCNLARKSTIGAD